MVNIQNDVIFQLCLEKRWEIIEFLVKQKTVSTNNFTDFKKKGCCALAFICQSGKFPIVKELKGWDKNEFIRIYNQNNSILSWLDFHNQSYLLKDIQYSNKIELTMYSYENREVKCKSYQEIINDKVNNHENLRNSEYDSEGYSGLSDNEYD